MNENYGKYECNKAKNKAEKLFVGEKTPSEKVLRGKRL